METISRQERDELKNRAFELRAQGKSVKKIAEELGRPKGTVGNWLAPSKPSAGVKPAGSHRPVGKPKSVIVPVETNFCSHCGFHLPNAYIVTGGAR